MNTESWVLSMNIADSIIKLNNKIIIKPIDINSYKIGLQICLRIWWQFNLLLIERQNLGELMSSFLFFDCEIDIYYYYL